MNDITRVESFEDLTRFDYMLADIDPALDVEAFNKFMLCPAIPAAPHSKASTPLHDDPQIREACADRILV